MISYNGGLMHKGCKIVDLLSISRIFTFFKKQFEPGYFFKGESHDFYEVVCVLSGKVGITAGKNVFVLSEGEMTFHTPGEFHAIRDEGVTTPEVIIFSFSATSFPSVAAKIFHIGKNGKKEIQYIYEEIVRCFHNEGGKICEVDEKDMLSAALAVKRLESFLIFNLLSEASRDISLATPSSASFYNILSVMEKSISASLNVSEIAKKCGISVPTLEKTIYKYLGYGAMAHYNTMKLQRAHTMLLEGASVKETALSLGFSNQSYFSARFKKYFGYSPSSVSRERSTN